MWGKYSAFLLFLENQGKPQGHRNLVVGFDVLSLAWQQVHLV